MIGCRPPLPSRLLLHLRLSGAASRQQRGARRELGGGGEAEAAAAGEGWATAAGLAAAPVRPADLGGVYVSALPAPRLRSRRGARRALRRRPRVGGRSVGRVAGRLGGSGGRDSPRSAGRSWGAAWSRAEPIAGAAFLRSLPKDSAGSLGSVRPFGSASAMRGRYRCAPLQLGASRQSWELWVPVCCEPMEG